MVGKLKAKGKKRYLVDAIWIVGVLAVTKILGKWSLTVHDTLGLYWMFQDYPFFFAGHIIQREGAIAQAFLWSDKRFDMAIIGFLGISALAMTCFTKRSGLVLQAAAPFTVYAIVCLFVKTSTYTDKYKHWLESLGRHSLDIYVLHYFLIQSCHLAFVAEAGSPLSGNYFVLTIMALLITLVIAFACMGLSGLIRQSRLFSFLFLGIRG